MMLKASYVPYRLDFNFKALTSRGALPYKDTYFIKVWNPDNPDKFGIGECALFRGLSAEDNDDYEVALRQLCRCINNGEKYDVSDRSSITFGLETAIADYQNGCERTPFPSDFSKGKGCVPINGLVWMGSVKEMAQRAEAKIESGFRCVKFKVGGQDFEQEFKLLERIRENHPPENLEIRLDANGAFTKDNALERLKRLSLLDIHSIEQPVLPGQWDLMAHICAESPIPIALDEELIGCRPMTDKCNMLRYIRPAYLILKPALCGGFSGADEWIEAAECHNIGWWATSALESNIGLNAIAQWVAAKTVTMPQGLGTGSLYNNNIASPLCLDGELLKIAVDNKWSFPEFKWITPE